MYGGPHIGSRSSSRTGGSHSGLSFYASSIKSGTTDHAGGMYGHPPPMKRSPGPQSPGLYGPAVGQGPNGYFGGPSGPSGPNGYNGYNGSGMGNRPKGPPVSTLGPINGHPPAGANAAPTKPNLKTFYKAFQRHTETTTVGDSKASTERPGVKARPKLQRLTDGHFTELATDVYDELMRRIHPSPHEMQHLAAKSSIHPKRNEAREKLSLLSPTRFSDLVSDLQYEAKRRDPYVEDNYVPPSSLPSPLPSPSSPLSSQYTGDIPNRAQSPAEPRIQIDHLGDFSGMGSLNNLVGEVPSSPHDRSFSVVSTDTAPFSNELDDVENERTTKTHIPIRDSITSASNAVDNSDRNSTVSVATSRYSEVSVQRPSEGLNIASVKPTLLKPEKSTLVEEEEDDEESEEEEEGYGDHTRSQDQDDAPSQDHSLVKNEFPNENIKFESDDDGVASRGSSQLRTNSGQIRDKDEQIQMLLNEGSRMDKVINELEQQLEESELLKSTLVEENGRLHDMVNELEEEKSKSNQDNENMRLEIDGLLKEKGLLELQVEKQNLANDETSEWKIKYDSAKNLADKHKAELDEALQQLEQARLDQSTAQQNLDQELTDHQLTKQQLERAEAAKESGESDQKAISSEDVPIKIEPEELEELQRQHVQTVEELAQQRQVTEQVRMEASAFLEEMRALTAQNGAASMMAEQIQALKVEVQEWKSRYARAKTQLRNIKAASVMGAVAGGLTEGLDAAELSPAYLRADGIIGYSNVTQFQMCMDEFIYKARSNNGDILEYLHAVVVATRNITQEVGSGAADSNSKAQPKMSDETAADMAQWTTIVSRTANQLITTTRNHRMAGGLAPFAVLDAAASDLSYAVIELVKLAGIRRDVDADEDFMAQAQPPSPKKADLPLATANGKENVQVPPKRSSKRYSQMRPISMISHHSALSFNSSNDQIFNKDDPDNTVSELQAFLEEKTGEAIENVQGVLAGIKQSEPAMRLVPHMYRIVELLEEIIDASGSAMKHSRNKLLRDKGGYIVQSLADCVERVRALHDQVVEEPADEELERQISQRIAGVSFDIARCTQELVKTVEEVSMVL